MRHSDISHYSSMGFYILTQKFQFTVTVSSQLKYCVFRIQIDIGRRIRNTEFIVKIFKRFINRIFLPYNGSQHRFGAGFACTARNRNFYPFIICNHIFSEILQSFLGILHKNLVGIIKFIEGFLIIHNHKNRTFFNGLFCKIIAVNMLTLKGKKYVRILHSSAVNFHSSEKHFYCGKVAVNNINKDIQRLTNRHFLPPEVSLSLACHQSESFYLLISDNPRAPYRPQE